MAAIPGSRCEFPNKTRQIDRVADPFPSLDPPPRHVFGAKGDVADNVTYVDETTVAYVAGHQLVLYHVETKTQRFIPGRADTEAITALAFSQCKSYVAVAERAEKGVITVYDLTTTTGSPRKRVLEGDVGSKVRLVPIREKQPKRSSKLGHDNDLIQLTSFHPNSIPHRLHRST